MWSIEEGCIGIMPAPLSRAVQRRVSVGHRAPGEPGAWGLHPVLTTPPGGMARAKPYERVDGAVADWPMVRITARRVRSDHDEENVRG